MIYALSMRYSYRAYFQIFGVARSDSLLSIMSGSHKTEV